MTADVTKPHAYDPDPRLASRVPPCMCGQTRAYRGHQPWWWRWLNPKARWR